MEALRNFSVTLRPSSAATNDPLPYWFLCLVAVTYFSILVFTLVLHSVIIRAIVRNPKDFSSAYYRYLISRSIAEIFGVYFHGTYGAICNLVGHCPGPPILNNLLCALSWFGWPVEIVSDLVIAVDRLTAICFSTHYARISEGKLPTILIAITWLIAVVHTVPFFTLIVPTYYDVRGVTTGIDFSAPFANSLVYTFFVFEMVVLAFAAAFYLVAIAFICRRRNMFSSKATAGGNSVMLRAQRSLMVQGALHFSMVVLNDTVYYCYVARYSVGIWGSFLQGAFYLSIPLVNALLTIALNSIVREKVRIIVGCARPPIDPSQSTSPARPSTTTAN